MDPIQPAEPPPPVEQPGQNVVVVPAPIPRGKEKAREELLGTAVYLGLALIVIGIILAILKFWARRQTSGESSTLSLSSYHEMYEDGELSEEEYQKIRAKMAVKLKQKMGIQKPTAGEAPIDLSTPGMLPMILPSAMHVPSPPPPPAMEFPSSPPPPLDYPSSPPPPDMSGFSGPGPSCE